MYSGQDALRSNILAARVIAETLKTALGPKGMDKLLVDASKDIAVTDSGYTILSLIRTKHPVAKMLIEAANVQKKEVGDGTTTAVVLTGELLKYAEKLMDSGLHPATIIRGYMWAGEKALEFLEELAFPASKRELFNLAEGILRGKVGSSEAGHLSRIAVEAVEIAGDEKNIKIEYRPGGKVLDSSLIRGVVIDLGKRVHPDMPKKISGARVLLIDKEFDVRNPRNAKIEIYDPEKMRAFSQYKDKVMRVAVEMIARAGANVVFCQKNIADIAMYYLSKAGIMGVRDVERETLKLLQKATGARIVGNINEVSPSVLGYAGLVEESKIGLEEIMYITECKENNTASILVRGGSENVAMEVKRRMENLISVLSRVKKENSAVAGGGAIELELAKKLRDYATSVSSREQLAISSYAEALEVIPKALVYNSGLDPIDMMVKLRSEHAKGNTMTAFEAINGRLEDARACGLIEYAGTKKQVLKSATSLACAILRIDEVLIKSRKEVPPAKPEAAPPEVLDFPAKEGKIDLGAMRGRL